MILLARMLKDSSTNKEEIHFDASIPAHIQFLLQLEEYSVHTFGNMVLKRRKIMLTWISPTIHQFLNKQKCRYKTKQIKLFQKATKFVNISKTKNKQNNSSGSIYIKEVLFQEIQLELSTLKELMLRLVVVLMPTTHLKQDGSRSLSHQELVMVFFVCITWQVRR